MKQHQAKKYNKPLYINMPFDELLVRLLKVKKQMLNKEGNKILNK